MSDTGARLLAAELEVARLRGALKKARRAMVWEVRELRGPRASHREYESAARLEGARLEAQDVILATPAPDLDELRGLVAAVAAFSGEHPTETWAGCRLDEALDAVLARYPLLGERP